MHWSQVILIPRHIHPPLSASSHPLVFTDMFNLAIEYLLAVCFIITMQCTVKHLLDCPRQGTGLYTWHELLLSSHYLSLFHYVGRYVGETPLVISHVVLVMCCLFCTTDNVSLWMQLLWGIHCTWQLLCLVPLMTLSLGSCQWLYELCTHLSLTVIMDHWEKTSLNAK